MCNVSVTLFVSQIVPARILAQLQMLARAIMFANCLCFVNVLNTLSLVCDAAHTLTVVNNQFSTYARLSLTLKSLRIVKLPPYSYWKIFLLAQSAVINVPVDLSRRVGI